jgi:hypothetical protein
LAEAAAEIAVAVAAVVVVVVAWSVLEQDSAQALCPGTARTNRSSRAQ